MEILLGSGSPRRKEILEGMGMKFRPISLKDIRETYPAGMMAEKVPEYLSALKAHSYTDGLQENQLLITADTVVIADGEILGKPADRKEAIAMLQKLSGRTHKVVTGVTLATKNESKSFSETTLVEFYPLSVNQIEHYVDTYRPFDKAGAYGIQEWIGMTGVKSINGCFYNVMGLPAAALYRQLSQLRALAMS